MDIDSIFEALGDIGNSSTSRQLPLEDLSRILRKLDALISASGASVPSDSLPDDAVRAWVRGDLVEAVAHLRAQSDLTIPAATERLRDALGDHTLVTLVERRVDALLDASGLSSE